MTSGKIRPNFSPNRPLLDFIIGGEFPKAESVIHRLQNPRKMAFPIKIGDVGIWQNLPRIFFARIGV
ncbi:unnamed protein product [Linum trigynum]|uniref:Uncharacterized protein n=1 Tax=Linum trigynum TaxID=586398 RepID=A0AAV2FEI3_9ROSI